MYIIKILRTEIIETKIIEIIELALYYKMNNNVDTRYIKYKVTSQTFY